MEDNRPLIDIIYNKLPIEVTNEEENRRLNRNINIGKAGGMVGGGIGGGIGVGYIGSTIVSFFFPPAAPVVAGIGVLAGI